jgi:hypothetical protein
MHFRKVHYFNDSCTGFMFEVWNWSEPPFHGLILIQKALKLCPSTQTPNNLVWILFWRNILSPSSDSLLKMQAVYSSETLLYSDHMLSKPRPHYVSAPLWKPEVKTYKYTWKKLGWFKLGKPELQILFYILYQHSIYCCGTLVQLLCYSLFRFLKLNKKVERYSKITSS